MHPPSRWTVVALALVAACDSSDDPSNHPCGTSACSTGFVCNPTTNRCEPAAPDAATADAPSARTISVTAFDDSSTPDTGASVVIQDADGNVLDTLAADAAGKVTAVAPSGSMLTLVQAQRVTVVAGVQPGDSYTFGTPPTTRTQTGSIQITATSFAGGSYVNAWGPCGSTGVLTGSPVTLPMYADCAPATPAAIVLEQTDSLFATLAFAELSLSLTGGSSSYALVPADWRTPKTLQVSVTGLDGTPVRIDQTVSAGGYFFTKVKNFGTGSVDVAATFAVPPSLSSFAYTTLVRYYPDSGSTLDTEQEISGTGTVAAGVSLAYSAFLPALSGGASDQAPGRPSFTWNLPGADAVDGGQLVFAIPDSGPLTYTIVVPPSTHFTFPALPDSLAAVRPRAGATPISLNFYQLANRGYDAFRTGAGSHVVARTGRVDHGG